MKILSMTDLPCGQGHILSGKARIEVDGESHDLRAGDVVICEPGEDHHLVSDEHHPCVNIYLHAGDTPRAQKRARV